MIDEKQKLEEDLAKIKEDERAHYNESLILFVRNLSFTVAFLSICNLVVYKDVGFEGILIFFGGFIFGFLFFAKSFLKK